MAKSPYKSGYVAIVGKPNVGKSTLLNLFLKDKVSIVTNKPQTTRHKIIGIKTGENYQIIFLDTPGVIEPKYELQKIMLDKVKQAIREDADLILMMVEPYPSEEKDLKIIDLIKKVNKPAILIINKIDLVKQKDLILPIIEEYQKLYSFQEIIPLSCKEIQGLDILLNKIIEYVPVGSPFYPEDQLTVQNERFLASEIIREKVFENFQEEIPYSTTVEISEFKEREKGKDYIRATLYVEKNSQKRMIIGKEGSSLKRLGELARKEIESCLGRAIYLEIWVKVKANWKKDKKSLKDFGYYDR